MKRIIFFVLVLVLMSTAALKAQVTIGSQTEPASGALLDLKTHTPTDSVGGPTTEKGLLLPRVALQTINSLAPLYTGVDADVILGHKGLVVYNVKPIPNVFTQGIYYWDGAQWVQSGAEAVTIALPAGIINGNVLKWDAGTSHWTTQPDEQGIVTITSPHTLTVGGSGTNAVTLALPAGTNGQVLKWVDSAWVPGADQVGTPSTGDGVGVATVTPLLNGGLFVNQTGDGTTSTGATATISIADNGVSIAKIAGSAVATAGTFLKQDGTWATPPDNNTFPAFTSTNGIAITGSGTNAVTLALPAGTNGQVLKWVNSAWVPDTDNVGTPSSGDGVGVATVAPLLNGGLFVNQTGDGTTSTGATATISIADNGVSIAKIAGSVAATAGTFLKQDGTWATPTDNNTFPAFTSTNGITVTGSATNAVTLALPTGNPVTGDTILVWRNNKWEPGKLPASGGSETLNITPIITTAGNYNIETEYPDANFIMVNATSGVTKFLFPTTGVEVGKKITIANGSGGGVVEIVTDATFTNTINTPDSYLFDGSYGVIWPSIVQTHIFVGAGKWVAMP
jgi:hypothetical protein